MLSYHSTLAYVVKVVWGYIKILPIWINYSDFFGLVLACRLQVMYQCFTCRLPKWCPKSSNNSAVFGLGSVIYWNPDVCERKSIYPYTAWRISRNPNIYVSFPIAINVVTEPKFYSKDICQYFIGVIWNPMW